MHKATNALLSRQQTSIFEREIHSIDREATEKVVTEDIRTVFGTAEKLIAHGDYEKARSTLLAAEEKRTSFTHVTNPAILNSVGVASSKLNRHEDALLFFRLALRVAENPTGAYAAS